MSNSLIIGRYVQGQSFIHRLDPRLKLVLSFYLITLVLFANNVLTYSMLFILMFSIIYLSKISVKFFVNGLKGLIWLILFTVLLQLLFSTGSHVYLSWGIIKITQEGCLLAIYTFLRFVLIVCFSTVLTLTTAPLELADATESLLRPLAKWKVPVQEIALMISIALRFIPTLMDEATTIMNAQKARGVNFNQGSLITRAKAIIPILVPLLVSSFNRAEQLADAMEARGYQTDFPRSHYRKLAWQKKDTGSLILIVVLTIVFFYIRT